MFEVVVLNEDWWRIEKSAANWNDINRRIFLIELSQLMKTKKHLQNFQRRDSSYQSTSTAGPNLSVFGGNKNSLLVMNFSKLVKQLKLFATDYKWSIRTVRWPQNVQNEPKHMEKWFWYTILSDLLICNNVN